MRFRGCCRAPADLVVGGSVDVAAAVTLPATCPGGPGSAALAVVEDELADTAGTPFSAYDVLPWRAELLVQC